VNPNAPNPDPTKFAWRSVCWQSGAILAFVACVVLGGTACGAKSGAPRVAQLTATESTPALGPPADGSALRTPSPASSESSKGPASSLTHAECMRSHGVPDFPDLGSIQIDVKSHPDLDPTSALFVAAQKACLSLAPGGTTTANTVSAQLQSAALAYSACMRSHGFPNFPDPVFDSRGEHVSINGLDTGSARFQGADKSCQTSSRLAAVSGAGSTGSGP
jgi:hypothetical protein